MDIESLLKPVFGGATAVFFMALPVNAFIITIGSSFVILKIFSLVKTDNPL